MSRVYRVTIETTDEMEPEDVADLIGRDGVIFASVAEEPHTPRCIAGEEKCH